MELKRYKMKCIYDGEEGTSVAVPMIRENGEYVKYDDIRHIIEQQSASSESGKVNHRDPEIFKKCFDDVMDLTKDME